MSRRNPYIGPREFRLGERLPARRWETRELASLLISDRIVLLHAPSGAGKTSLINAGLSPFLIEGGQLNPSPPVRVNAPPVEGVRNRYTYSVALQLLDTAGLDAEARNLTLAEIIDAAKRDQGGAFYVLILDQMEEILLLDPAGLDQQRSFFRELGECLSSGDVWLLLSMREDYMGGLARFARFLPGHLSSRYRLDYLDREAAVAAIQEPARDRDVEFSDKAAQRLVQRLATATRQTPGGSEEEVPAPYVQPVQLQVVCRRLWRFVREEAERRGAAFTTITPKDVTKHADISAALKGFYADTVAHVAAETGADEQAIRLWFEDELITPAGYRSQALTGPISNEIDPVRILRELEASYLLRSDPRGEATWYEIAHDRLVRPIREDNDNWMRPHLHPWQLAARDWEVTRDPRRLIGSAELRTAQQVAEKMTRISDCDQAFLDASDRAERESGYLAKNRSLATIQRRFTAVGLIAIFEAGLIVILLATLLAR
jgi:hypothetical protein